MKGGAFALQAGQGHQLPLLDEEVATIFTCLTDFLELVSHEFSFNIANAFRESSLNVDCEPFRTLYSSLIAAAAAGLYLNNCLYY